MRSPEAGYHVETFSSLDALPVGADALFTAADNFFATRAWWHIVLAHAIPAGGRPLLLLIHRDGQAAALFPMLQEAGDFRALTTPYTGLYEPLIAPGADRLTLFMIFARYCRRYSTTRLDALDAAAAAEFAAGARAAGLFPAGFEHFGNWHEDISGLDWNRFLASRPGALRETIRRRTRRAERLADAHFDMFCNRNDIAAGITAFETVYARSWKEPEPFPAFNPAQIEAAGELGMARLGVWRIGDVPVAAQFWIVAHRRATVLKLAHDEAFKAHSPGTVLTAWMVRHMIEQEQVTELDFGRGDDAYKQGWVATRRQRVGLLLINLLRPRGLAALARHGLGRMRARLSGT